MTESERQAATGAKSARFPSHDFCLRFLFIFSSCVRNCGVRPSELLFRFTFFSRQFWLVLNRAFCFFVALLIRRLILLIAAGKGCLQAPFDAPDQGIDTCSAHLEFDGPLGLTNHLDTHIRAADTPQACRRSRGIHRQPRHARFHGPKAQQLASAHARC